MPTGYYGKWAPWRDASDDDVSEALAAGRPYVVRFRSPGVAGRRVEYVDAIRGRIETEDNYNDVVILKSSDQALRLPTYHFAHAVDDHLMRVSLVLRAEEWLPSVPLHLQLFDALAFERIEYAHIAQLLKKEGASKRKLSKRKDPEASVDFYVEAGYPVPAVLYYLRGLANGRLAELPLAVALADSDSAGGLRFVRFPGRSGQARRHLRRLRSDDVAGRDLRRRCWRGRRRTTRSWNGRWSRTATSRCGR